MQLNPYHSSLTTYHAGDAQAVFSPTVAPKTLYQEEDFSDAEDSAIDYSVPGNRLIQHRDGSLELIPKSPAYIFGEKVVRPALDTAMGMGHRTYNFLKEGFTSVDHALSRMFNFIPGAEGTQVAQAEEHNLPSVIALKTGDRAAAAIWSKFGTDPGAYAKFVDSLPAAQKLDIGKDAVFLSNFLRIQTMVTELSKYVVNKAKDYTHFKVGIRRTCLSSKYLEKNLLTILKDLKDNKHNSNYSPTSNQVIVLTFPEYSDNYQKVLKAGGILQNQVRMTPMLNAHDFEELRTICSTNPIEAALLEHLSECGALFRILNIYKGDRSDFSFEEFKKLFGTEIVDNLLKNINELKENLELGIDSVENITTLTTQSFEEYANDKLYEHIHLIYQEHKKIVDKSGGWLTITPTDFRDNLVTSWDVTEIGRIFADKRLFRFRVGDEAHLKDEL